MEDWDLEINDTNNEEPKKLESVGKIFGGRGRGFNMEKKESTNNQIGRNYNTCNENSGSNEWNYNNNGNKDYNLNEQNKSRNKKNFQERKEGIGKPKSTYIPDAPTDDVNEIFGNSISSGINFKNYDNIEVKVSGENPPKEIKSFYESNLSQALLEVIKKCNYTTPTPIQKFSIPIIMEGHDMMACAQTGSGKTAAYLIPIINRLMEEENEIPLNSVCTPEVLILSPTRELSIQIFNEARKFSYGTTIKVIVIYGGTSVLHQATNIKKGCNILVGTLGRLLDFVTRGIVNFSKIRFLVLDEADRMLNMGFLQEIQKIMSHPSMVASDKRQTLMFSATFPEEVQLLAQTFLKNYMFVAVGIVGGACSDVKQQFFSVKKYEKRNKLIELLSKGKNSKCLVFVELKRMADFIATFLCEKNFPATSIHGDREQKEREEALWDFKTGRMNILVATSVAARGLDIKDVSHVLNFDLPSSIDEYVHRIGRTGRVGNRGLATSFFDPDKDSRLAPYLVKILKQAKQEIPDFLLEVPDHGETQDILSEFGGNDYRENNWDSCAKVATFEDEQW